MFWCWYSSTGYFHGTLRNKIYVYPFTPKQHSLQLLLTNAFLTKLLQFHRTTFYLIKRQNIFTLNSVLSNSKAIKNWANDKRVELLAFAYKLHDMFSVKFAFNDAYFNTAKRELLNLRKSRFLFCNTFCGHAFCEDF